MKPVEILSQGHASTWLKMAMLKQQSIWLLHDIFNRWSYPLTSFIYNDVVPVKCNECNSSELMFFLSCKKLEDILCVLQNIRMLKMRTDKSVKVLMTHLRIEKIFSNSFPLNIIFSKQRIYQWFSEEKFSLLVSFKITFPWRLTHQGFFNHEASIICQ